MSSYYLHRKTGGIYRVLYREYVYTAKKESETVAPMYVNWQDFGSFFTVTDDFPAGTHVTFYENVRTGQRWARASEMFHDGRFQQFTDAPLLLQEAQP